MKRFIIISSKQKLIICLVSITFIVLSAIIVTALDFPKSVQTSTSRTNTITAPEKENKQLKEILSSIVPADNNILFEDTFRNAGTPYTSANATDFKSSEVISKGVNLPFVTVYSDDEYLRPIYSSSWKQAYFRGWLYLPRKIISSRHSLFTYVGSAGKIFDIDGDLGFYPNISIDNQNYINFLIYNFDLQNIAQLGNQIVISGIPLKKGVQIVSIKTNDVSIQTKDSENIAIQLCTPAGYEIDYQNVQIADSANEAEDYGLADEATTVPDGSSVDLSRQNHQLRQELTHYISDSSQVIYFQQNGSYKTSNVLNTNIDLEDAFKCSSAIDYNIIYNNSKYRSPVFHPEWREHYDRDWCYIPRKMYINMKRLFVLPADKNVAYDLCGELGFFDEYPAIGNNRIGLLINNFSAQSVKIFEDNILVTGTPSRTGIQIVSLNKTNLTKYKEYAVRLVTKDLCEIDTDAVVN